MEEGYRERKARKRCGPKDSLASYPPRRRPTYNRTRTQWVTDKTQSTADRTERWTVVQNRFKRLEKNIDEATSDINRALAISQAVNDKLDDLALRVTSCEIRIASAREARENWFEVQSRLTDDVLKIRSLVNALREDKHD